MFTSILLALLLPFTSSQRVPVVSLKQLLQSTQVQNDTLYVVNFWATWCKPCIAEMPYFEQANTAFKATKVKVIFVSLNLPKETAVVKKFVAEHKLKVDVYLLQEGNPNLWLNKIDTTWSGSIPATVIYKNGKKIYFHQGEFTQLELDSVIQLKNQ